jgi:spore maturation protein CgeB
MRIVLFVHSLLSDWNHGNAHFLRGIATELLSRGYDVLVFEPAGGWSLTNLLAERGEAAFLGFRETYPWLTSRSYDPATLDLEEALDGADLVLVHEWNDPDLVRRLGEHRRRHRDLRLLFHDTHHRAVTAPATMAGMAADALGEYDGVLAFGAVLRDLYLARGWAAKAWAWHEAADTRVFHPIIGLPHVGDLVWVGNWGDEERTAELHEFLLEPVKALGLKARVHGVRYPDEAKAALAAAGIEYAGWLPNYEVPLTFARYGVTLHVPRRPYALALPGIPTIRPFEALACGIPLVSAPWEDCEGLFTPGADFLVARDGEEMKRHLRDLQNDPDLAAGLARHGRFTILDRHTCSHRVDELLDVYAEIAPVRAAEETAPLVMRTI